MGQHIAASQVNIGDEKVIRVNRTSAVVKGGRRFSFSAMVVVGDRRGVVGWGKGRAREVPASIEKATRDARQNLRKYPLRGDTIPHEVVGRYRASRVVLRPAAPGTGIKAGAAVRSVLEELGIRNVLTKIYGSGNPTNVVKAVFNGLDQLLSKEEAFKLRGLPVYADKDRPKLEPTGHEDKDKGDRRPRKNTKVKGKKPAKAKAPKTDAKPKADAPKAETKPATEAPKPEVKASEKPAEKPAEKKDDNGSEDKKES